MSNGFQIEAMGLCLLALTPSLACDGPPQQPVAVPVGSGPVLPSQEPIELGDGFTMRQAGGLGFCPTTEGIFEATVSAGADGGFTLTSSRLIEGDPTTDTCLELAIPERICFVEVPLSERVLTDEQVEEVRSLLGAIPADGCRPERGFGAADPCQQMELSTENHRLFSVCIGEGGNVAQFTQSFWALSDFLTSLALGE